MTKWGSLYLAGLLLLLVLWFCTPTGFLGAIVAAAILVALGTLVLGEKHRPSASGTCAWACPPIPAPAFRGHGQVHVPKFFPLRRAVLPIFSFHRELRGRGHDRQSRRHAGTPRG